MADRKHTLADAQKALRRIKHTAKPLKYITALHGSTVLKGRGNDIDIVCLASVEATLPASSLALLLVKKYAARLYVYEEDADAGIGAIFLTSDNLYIDLLVKGVPDA